MRGRVVFCTVASCRSKSARMESISLSERNCVDVSPPNDQRAGIARLAQRVDSRLDLRFAERHGPARFKIDFSKSGVLSAVLFSEINQR